MNIRPVITFAIVVFYMPKLPVLNLCMVEIILEDDLPPLPIGSS